MEIPLFQVDAFPVVGPRGPVPFSGNPAAVCPLPHWLPDDQLQAMAAENNLAETAYLVAHDATSHSGPGDYHLRWFSPEVEVELCGHATLASAHVVFTRLRPGTDRVAFSTLSGRLEVTADGDRLRMDLPALPPEPHATDPALAAALGADPREVLMAGRWLAVLDSAATVRDLRPDVAALGRLEPPYVIVTAPGEGEGVDVVSRFFAPGAGIDEDPVTGSAHCVLAPYWAARLGRTRFTARQLSARGGDLDCELVGDRVVLRGTCADYLVGTVTLK